MTGKTGIPAYLNIYSVARGLRRVERPLLASLALWALGGAILASPGAARARDRKPRNPAGPAVPSSISGSDRALGEEADGSAVARGRTSTSAEEDYSRAIPLLRARDWERSIPFLRSALGKDPESAPITLDLARALAFTGHRVEALRLLNPLLSRESGAVRESLIRRIRLLSTLFLKNEDFQIHQDGVNLMLLHKYKPARERLERALEREPGNVEVLTRLGQCLELDGDHDAAIQRLREAQSLNPYEPEIHLWAGRAMERAGDPRGALVELRAAGKELPSSELAAIWIAEALEAQGRPDRAIESLESDLRRYPTHVQSLIAESRLRLQDSSAGDIQSAWMARKDLQLALSRLEPYLAGGLDGNARPDFGGGLVVDLRPPEADLRKEIDHLMSEAQSRIDAARSQDAGSLGPREHRGDQEAGSPPLRQRFSIDTTLRSVGPV